MTHQMRTTALDEIGQLLAEQGFDGLADALRVLLNEVMKIERAALGAGPYQRAEGRTGHANGYKPKTVRTRVGALTLAVPQTRGWSSTPRPWRRGSDPSGP
jgi:transposase-like protein